MTRREVPARGPLRIAHVQPMSLDFYGHKDDEIGRSVRYSVTNLAEAQARAGDCPRVHLVASSKIEQLGFRGIEVRLHAAWQLPQSFGDRWRFARQFSFSMLRELTRTDIDIVHFHGSRQFQAMFALVAWKAERAGLPLVAQERGYRTVGPVVMRLQRYAIAKSAALLAASSEGVEALAALGAPRSRLSVFSNGFDPAVFYPDPDPEPPGEPFRLLAVTRFTEGKDPLTLAKGVSEFSRRTSRRVTMTVAGRGPLRDQFQQRLLAEQIPVRVIDHVDQAQLAGEYRAAHVKILTPYLAEGWTQAALEAMACGTPIIGTEVPGLRDCIGDAGLTVPPRNAGALADGLQALLLNPGNWYSRRAAGLERATKFTWDIVAEQLRRIYAGALRLGSQ